MASGAIDKKDSAPTSAADSSVRIRIFVVLLNADLEFAIDTDLAFGQQVCIDGFYPGEALITATILAIVPYILLRGPVRLWAQWREGRDVE